jgi:hypothetical protein
MLKFSAVAVGHLSAGSNLLTSQDGLFLFASCISSSPHRL